MGGQIPTKRPAMTWLVENVADVVTKYLQVADGRTACERFFGKKVHEEGLLIKPGPLVEDIVLEVDLNIC